MFGAAKAVPTKAPSDRTGKWKGLPFKEFQWVKLKTEVVTTLFLANDVVQLYDARHSNPTPTKRAGQTNGWQKTDFDTVYKIRKLVQQDVVQLCLCQDFGGAILHQHLTRTPDGEPAKVPYKPGDTVYLKPTVKTNRTYCVRYPPGSSGGTLLPIPDGACGVISSRTTIKGGQAMVNTNNNAARGQSIQRDPYVVLFPVTNRISKWEECNHALHRSYLEDTTDAEKQTWNEKLETMRTPPPPRVKKCTASQIMGYPRYSEA